MINRILTFINRILFNRVKVDARIPVKYNVGKMTVTLISSTGHRFGDIELFGELSTIDLRDSGIFTKVIDVNEKLEKLLNEAKAFEVSPGRYINRNKVERFEVSKIEDYFVEV